MPVETAKNLRRFDGLSLAEAFLLHACGDGPSEKDLCQEIRPFILDRQFLVCGRELLFLSGEKLSERLYVQRNHERWAYERKRDSSWRKRFSDAPVYLPVPSLPPVVPVEDGEQSTLRLIAAQFNELLEWLRQGTIVGHGKSMPSGLPEDIDQTYWSKPDMKIDLERNELGSGSARKWVARYEAIRLRVPKKSLQTGNVADAPIRRRMEELAKMALDAGKRISNVQLVEHCGKEFPSASDRRLLDIWDIVKPDAWKRGGKIPKSQIFKLNHRTK